MNIFDAISKRATYRGPYKNMKIPREDLGKIVQAAIDAPSGCNAQTTSFIIVDDEKMMKDLSEIMPKGGMDTATAAIVVLADKTPAYDDVSFYKEDYSAAVQNIYLAATALGYATCWLDGVLRGDNVNTKISNLLSVPEDILTCVLLPIGVPEKEVKLKPKKPFSQRASYNKYTIESE
ncbi:MAG: nitroreductase family protein [Eubacteriales bacterium]